MLLRLIKKVQSALLDAANLEHFARFDEIVETILRHIGMTEIDEVEN